MSVRVGSLCSGYGGLELAVIDAISPAVRVVWCADDDEAAARVLAHRWPDTPNLGDLTLVDWRSVEPVDLLTAGWPCQPWSLAGKRKGAADDRAIWPGIARAVRGLRPRLCLLENVPAVVTAGELARAAGDLAAVGYDAQWCCIQAADAGAPHRRRRLFLAAWPADTDRGGLTWVSERHRLPPSRLPASRRDDADRRGGAPDGALSASSAGALLPTPCARDSHGPGWKGDLPRAAALLPTPMGRDAHGRHGRHGFGLDLPGAAALLPTPTTSDRFGAGVHGDGGLDLRTTISLLPPPTGWGEWAAAVERWETILGRPAPQPTVTDDRGVRALNPLLVEWMMGLPEGWVTDVPDLSRAAQLRLLGNGVVPQQGALAMRLLLGAPVAADRGAVAV